MGGEIPGAGVFAGFSGGSQIAGYRLIKTIAESATAAVYLARNDDLTQPVALKVQALKGRGEVTEAEL